MNSADIIIALQFHFGKTFERSKSGSYYFHLKGKYGNWVPIRISDHCSEFECKQVAVWGVPGIDAPIQWGCDKIISYISQRLESTPFVDFY